MAIDKDASQKILCQEKHLFPGLFPSRGLSLRTAHHWFSLVQNFLYSLLPLLPMRKPKDLKRKEVNYIFSLFKIDRTKMHYYAIVFNSTLMRIFARMACKFLPEEHNHANTIVRIRMQALIIKALPRFNTVTFAENL